MKTLYMLQTAIERCKHEKTSMYLEMLQEQASPWPLRETLPAKTLTRAIQHFSSESSVKAEPKSSCKTVHCGVIDP